MRASRDGTRRGRQRRRRYAAAAVCLVALLLDPLAAHGLSDSAGSPRLISSGTARAGVAGHSPARRLPNPSTGLPGFSKLAGSVTPSQSAKSTGSTGQSGSESAETESTTVPAAENPPAVAMTVSDPLEGSAFSGLPQVGAIFSYDGASTGSHFCTGSVVSSSVGDLVVTAAHCVYDSSSGSYINDIAFVPGYHDGQEPYGIWTPSKIVVAQQWMDDADPDYDVAFVVVHQPGSSARIQDAVGADTLGINPSYSALSQVVGYPTSTEQPIACTNQTTQFSSTQLEFDCAGFPDGTSGGPFLTGVDAQTGLGTVSGVIGGYEEGGDSPDVSYTAYFGSSVADLFAEAEAAG
jgi:V8-like Glu-specific endopeptidase